MSLCTTVHFLGLSYPSLCFYYCSFLLKNIYFLNVYLPISPSLSLSVSLPLSLCLSLTLSLSLSLSLSLTLSLSLSPSLSLSLSHSLSLSLSPSLSLSLTQRGSHYSSVPIVAAVIAILIISTVAGVLFVKKYVCGGRSLAFSFRAVNYFLFSPSISCPSHVVKKQRSEELVTVSVYDLACLCVHVTPKIMLTVHEPFLCLGSNLPKFCPLVNVSQITGFLSKHVTNPLETSHYTA